MLKENEFIISNVVLMDLLEAVTNKRKSLRFKAKGFSMFPFICNSDVVTISPFSNSHIGLGQAVAFIHPQTQELAVHRIIGKKGNDYIIKGDNIFAIDGAVPRENILGYVSIIERKGKKVILGLGWERRLIVFLSRIRLISLIARIGKFIPVSIRRFLNEKFF